MFNALRRLHGHNLENQGLNDLSDAFQNFVTRARFFSIGRLRFYLGISCSLIILFLLFLIWAKFFYLL